jgi:hypothetical protein
MLNVYSGNVTTDDKGEARVNLPKYFEALNQDFRYQLTVIGQFAQAIVAQEIRKNQFTIKTDQPRVKVSWQVSGTRRDPWAAANRIAVEEEKAADEKGRYLHPELWGQSEEATIHRSAQGEDPLRAVGQLMPDELRQRVERHLGALQRGDQVDHDGLRSLVGEARRLAELRPREEPARIDPTRLEAEWRRVEELVRRMGPTPPSREADAARLRQIGQLMPEPVRELVERRLQALQQGEHLGPEELRSLVVEARQQADLPGRDEPPRIDEARLQDDWRQVQELVRRKPGGASDRTGRTRGSPKA